MSSIKESVLNIVTDQFGVDVESVTDDTSFSDDLGADSLDLVELVMEFEERFDISIPEEDAENIKTLGQAVEHIERLKKD